MLATPDLGGTYQYSLSMLEALRHVEGYEITLYSDPSNRDLAQFGYAIREYTEPRVRQLAYLAADAVGARLRDLFEREDILLAPIYSLALLHTAKPFAYTLHDLQEHYYPENFSWLQRHWRWDVHRRLSRRAARIICESNYVKSDIVRLFDVADKQVAVIAAPPLQQIVAEFDAAGLEAVRARLDLPNRFIFYPAQFWPHKNHLRLIEAFRQVAAQQSDLQLVLTGKKRDEYEVVMQAVAKAGITERVLHLGYIEQADLQAIYHLASMLVMPSLFESVSIPIYEAFQAGTPVAASGILSIPEQVGCAGLLFDPFSASSIASAILKFAGDADLSWRLGSAGRQRMRSMTHMNYGKRLQDVLTDLSR